MNLTSDHSLNPLLSSAKERQPADNRNQDKGLGFGASLQQAYEKRLERLEHNDRMRQRELDRQRSTENIAQRHASRSDDKNVQASRGQEKSSSAASSSQGASQNTQQSSNENANRASSTKARDATENNSATQVRASSSRETQGDAHTAPKNQKQSVNDVYADVEAAAADEVVGVMLAAATEGFSEELMREGATEILAEKDSLDVVDSSEVGGFLEYAVNPLISPAAGVVDENHGGHAKALGLSLGTQAVEKGDGAKIGKAAAPIGNQSTISITTTASLSEPDLSRTYSPTEKLLAGAELAGTKSLTPAESSPASTVLQQALGLKSTQVLQASQGQVQLNSEAVSIGKIDLALSVTQPLRSDGLSQSPTLPLPAVNGLSTSAPSVLLPANSGSPQQLPVNIQFGQHGWSSMVAERSALMATQNIKFAELQLDPPELGPLQVKVSIHQDQASVSFIAASPQVKDALDASVSRLRELLEEQGLDLLDVDISEKEQQASDQEQDQNNLSNRRPPETALEDDAELGPQDSESVTLRYGIDQMV